MMKLLIVCFMIFYLMVGDLLSETPPAPSPGTTAMRPEKLKESIKSVKTDASNFDTRVEFAPRWIALLANRGKAEEVQRAAPIGTIQKIKQAAQASPESAYRELDNVFRELERIEKTIPPDQSAPPAQTGSVLYRD